MVVKSEKKVLSVFTVMSDLERIYFGKKPYLTRIYEKGFQILGRENKKFNAKQRGFM